MAYEPTKGPLPGEQWKPSNGTAVFIFTENWCSNCAKDKAFSEGKDIEDCAEEELCKIIVAASFRGEAVEWRRMPNGETKCIAFVEKEQPIPVPRCTKTCDMFDAENVRPE